MKELPREDTISGAYPEQVHVLGIGYTGLDTYIAS